MQTLFLDTTEGKQFFEKLNSLICRVITVQVMAFTQVSPTHENTIHSLLKSKEDMMRRHTCRTHYPHGPDIRGVLQPTDPSQVSSGVCSPCAQEA
jgi:NAD-dependent oxidoreductase involved in siderophore biosynthesis